MTDRADQRESIVRTQLSAEKQALLARRLQKASLHKKSKSLEIPHSSEPGPAPLSFAQQRLWFLDQVVPHSPLYTVPLVMSFTGPLRIDLLEQGINKIVQRHEILRTTFLVVNDHPQQIISPIMPLSLSIIDLQQMPDRERQIQRLALAQEEARNPFHLATGPLIRALVLRSNTREHFLLLTIHHIIFDSWSTGILLQDLAAFYEASLHGQPAPSDLPVQYRDYAVWQRQWLQGQRLQILIDYWRKQLTNAPGLLELSFSHPRAAVCSFQGNSYHFTLSRTLVEKLQALSQSKGVTLFMTLLAAFQLLLYHFSGQEDIVVGIPIAGRTREETEELIGFFVNTLAIRTRLTGNPSFLELLRRVREAVLGAFAHQDMPFERLIEELRLERSLSYNPLFQVMFASQNAFSNTVSLPGLSIQIEEGESGTAKFDFTFKVEETSEGLAGKVEYNTQLFEATAVKRMVEHWQTLLENVTIHPEKCISDFPSPMLHERQQLSVVEESLTSASSGEQGLNAQQLLKTVNQLSDEEVTSLLSSLLSEDEADE